MASAPGGAGDTVVVAAITRGRADPSEVARAEYRVRMHLDELQASIGYGDRVDRFAIGTHSAERRRTRRCGAINSVGVRLSARIGRATSPSRRRAPFSS